MRFQAIASSSHGNAYLVEDGQTRILLECGLAYRTLQKKLGFSLAELDAVLLTHEHKDHSRCAGELARSGHTVYMSAGTALALGLAEEKPLSVIMAPGNGAHCAPLRENGEHCSPLQGPYPVDPEAAVAVIGEAGVEFVEDREQFRVGSLDVVPFATYHDAAEPLGYLIRSRADGDVLAFATDTVNLRYRFPGLRILGIEANYDKAILERCTKIPDKTRHRITNTHMEIDTLCEILEGMNRRGELRECREIWLLHLSDATSHKGHFINKVRRVVPPWVTVRAAAR